MQYTSRYVMVKYLCDMQNDVWVDVFSPFDAFSSFLCLFSSLLFPAIFFPFLRYLPTYLPRRYIHKFLSKIWLPSFLLDDQIRFVGLVLVLVFLFVWFGEQVDRWTEVWGG